MLTAKRWPNGLGWDVGTRAEVWDANGSVPMRCRIFLPDIQRWEPHPLRGEPRFVTVERTRIGTFPRGTDPLECARQTRLGGTILEH